MTRIPDTEQIRQKLKVATPNVRSFIVSKEFIDAFEKIRITYKLHFDEASKLSDALGAVFLEMIPASEFPALVQESLESNKDVYAKVLHDVNENIFTVFKKTLKPIDEGTAEKTNTKVEQVHINEPSPAHGTVEVNVLNKESLAPEKPSYRMGNDPYREPVE